MTKIMIVEDSNLMIAIITNFLKKKDKDYEIISASDGNEAVEKFKSEKPDVVFMDIKMQGMDGMTALAKIREIDSNAKIVMCTSLGEPEQEQKAKDLGAIAYIKKPFSSADIFNVLKEHHL
jgi:two-component system, chemotaxis family, chemotaxis protein CheY